MTIIFLYFYLIILLNTIADCSSITSFRLPALTNNRKQLFSASSRNERNHATKLRFVGWLEKLKDG